MKIVGTAIIKNNEGKILIGQRPEGKALAGLWEFPGGKQEEGESVEACIVREIKEELEIDCVVGEFLMSVSKVYPHGEFKLMVYETKAKDLSKLKAVVHQDLRWVGANELDDYEFPEADGEIIAYLKAHHQG